MNFTNLKSKFVIYFSFIIFFLVSCGSTEFRGGTGFAALDKQTQNQRSSDQHEESSNDQDSDGKNSNENDNDSENPNDDNDNWSNPNLKLVNWSWPCGCSNNEGDYTAQKNISGSGNFTLADDVTTIDELKLNFDVGVCENSNRERDILFLIDVSWSMSRNDPISGNSCGRLRAIEDVIEVFSVNPRNRFAVITFASRNVNSSTDFFAQKTDLFNDIQSVAGESNIRDVICDSHLGTDYYDGLAAARELINTQIGTNAKVDIFMVSDGKPIFGQTGKETADYLKANNATIATIMAIKGREDVLRDEIASKDQNGNPYYRKLEKIDDLTSTLLELVQMGDKSSKLGYKSSDLEEWTVIDILTETPGQINLNTLSINPKNYPTGLDVFYEYSDNTNTGKKRVFGKLRWKKSIIDLEDK